MGLRNFPLSFSNALDQKGGLRERDKGGKVGEWQARERFSLNQSKRGVGKGHKGSESKASETAVGKKEQMKGKAPALRIHHR